MDREGRKFMTLALDGIVLRWVRLYCARGKCRAVTVEWKCSAVVSVLNSYEFYTMLLGNKCREAHADREVNFYVFSCDVLWITAKKEIVTVKILTIRFISSDSSPISSFLLKFLIPLLEGGNRAYFRQSMAAYYVLNTTTVQRKVQNYQKSMEVQNDQSGYHIRPPWFKTPRNLTHL